MFEDCISNSHNSNEIRKEVKSGKDHDAFSLLRKQRLEYPKNVILGHLNISSLRNKLFSVSELIKGKVEIFQINETKLDESFPCNQFAMYGHKFVRRDRSKFGGSIAFYITDQLPSRTIKIENPSDIKIPTTEMTIHKNKILVAGIYKPPNHSETDLTTNLETIISKLPNKYEKLILIDFNMTTSNLFLSQILDTFALSPLNIDPTCFKNSKNQSCIDLLLTNFKPSFMKTSAFETGISDHHKMISTIMKLHFTRESPKTKYYREYRKFDIDYFSSELSRQLDSTFSSFKENEDCDEFNEFNRFHRVFLSLLNIQAPLKKEIFGGNNSPFITKTLRKAIMIKSRLKNRFNKTRSDELDTLQNTKELLYEIVKKDYKKVNPKLASDNKNIWRTISQIKETFLTKL